jgi:hypothetical protein
MKHWWLIIGLLAASTSFGNDYQLTWNYRCTSDNSKCWLEKFVMFSGQYGEERGGVAVAYDNKAKAPMFITIFVPKGLPLKTELIVRFVDSVKKNGKWTLEPAADGFIALPLSECDKDYCMARVHAGIQDSGGTPINLFDELKKRRFLWVMFKRGPESERFLVPVSGINDALASIN